MCYCISCNQDNVVNKEQGSNTDLVEENTQTRQVKVPAHVRHMSANNIRLRLQPSETVS